MTFRKQLQAAPRLAGVEGVVLGITLPFIAIFFLMNRLEIERESRHDISIR